MISIKIVFKEEPAGIVTALQMEAPAGTPPTEKEHMTSAYVFQVIKECLDPAASRMTELTGESARTIGHEWMKKLEEP